MKLIKTFSVLFLGFFSTALINGCATIMHGTKQSIGISSNPSDASVWIDKVFTGKTPIITEMSRNNDHIVRIELDGYQPYEATFSKKVSGWVFGNIAFGGLIGLAVDAITGGIYTLTPEQVQAEMRTNRMAYSNRSNDSCIFVVLQPDPSWKRVDNLVAAK
jgi:hypothetical protein